MIDYYDLIEQLYEGFYDTDVLAFLQGKEKGKWDKLKISPEEKKRIQTMLALPDARPAAGDRTFEAWLYRISLWGKIKIKHNNPDEKIRNASLSYDQFLDLIDDQRRTAIYGKWQITYPKIDLVKFSRKFYSFLLSKEIVEEIIVEIDLRENLKKVLKQARRSAGLFGMF